MERVWTCICWVYWEFNHQSKMANAAMMNSSLLIRAFDTSVIIPVARYVESIWSLHARLMIISLWSDLPLLIKPASLDWKQPRCSFWRPFRLNSGISCSSVAVLLDSVGTARTRCHPRRPRLNIVLPGPAAFHSLASWVFVVRTDIHCFPQRL